jgi:1-aminocyclopropane-1-carboxylate synthase
MYSAWTHTDLLGRCYPPSTLLAIHRFCTTHALHLIADEIYALSTFPSPGAHPFTSMLSLPPSDTVHVTYGLSKDFGAAGLKIGALVTRNAALKKAVHAVLRFSATSGPSVALATAMLEDRAWCQWFVGEARRRIADACVFVTEALREEGVECYAGNSAGFFVWVNLRKWLPPQGGDAMTGFEKECKLAERCVEGGVFLQPGEEHAVEPGWFRIVYTMEREVVQVGIRRLGKVLSEVTW